MGDVARKCPAKRGGWGGETRSEHQEVLKLKPVWVLALEEATGRAGRSRSA